MRLAGKRVLITGTAGGQGEAAQAMFAREGARVVGCDVQASAAERTAAELRDKGYDVTGHTVDLSDADAARSWVDEAAAALGGIDVLYNNAAGFGFAPTLNLAIFTLPCISVAISSSAGAIIRHGPHHSAQKSTTTGSLDSMTSVAQLASVTLAVADMKSSKRECGGSAAVDNR